MQAIRGGMYSSGKVRYTAIPVLRDCYIESNPGNLDIVAITFPALSTLNLPIYL